MVFQIIRAIVFFPLLIFFPTRFINKKKIPKGKAILLSNHTSNLDPVLLVYKTTRRYRGLAKKELFKNKFLGWFFKKLGMIPVDRENTDLNAIKECIKILKDDKPLLIFPEGTRNKTGTTEFQEIKNGAAMLAIKANAPIIPVYIQKKPRFLVFNRIVYGEPFYLDEFTGKRLDAETLAQAGEVISQKLKENSQYFENKKTSKK